MSVEQGIRFSVVIPVYNAAATIARTLHSVLEQSYPALEVIVVDDASKDETVDIIEQDFGGRVTLIKKLFNSGSSTARNTGMDAAKGDHIAFIDADDTWHINKLELLNMALRAKPGTTLFYHPYTQESLASKKLPDNITIYKLPFIKLLPANLIATSCAVMRNDPAYRFDTSMRYTEDFDLWLRMGYGRQIHFVNIPLTQIYRPYTSKGGISENKWKMRRGEMKAYRHLVRLNVLFVVLLPFLILGSLGKHVYKLVFPA